PNNLTELVTWLKENPGKATVGIPGVGGGADVLGTYFQRNTGTRFQFVPYRGGAPMIQDLVAGQIDLTFTQVASSLAQVRAGQIKAYAVMANTRWWATPRLQLSMRRGCQGCTRPSGTAYGLPKARPRMLSPSSMPHSWTPWRIERCASGSPTWVRKSGRATN